MVFPQQDDCDGQGNDADGVKGPEDLFDQGLQDEAYSEWHEAYEVRTGGRAVKREGQSLAARSSLLRRVVSGSHIPKYVSLGCPVDAARAGAVPRSEPCDRAACGATLD